MKKWRKLKQHSFGNHRTYSSVDTATDKQEVAGSNPGDEQTFLEDHTFYTFFKVHL